ncbi:receptor-like protein kinase ANXUR2 [Diospyros lotus]|uniref:receptor-like protein kinase ANXUR2 n=1 Tax=Diospyros lotus TaxID=55363 RepID=UPI00225887D9|nr:receptor-like protein kinase ANXUR2 [Diospyros lotus]
MDSIATTRVLLLSVICWSLLVNYLNAAGSAPKPLILSCGKKGGGHDESGRKWEYDSGFLVSTQQTVEAGAEVQDSSLSSDVPFMNARIFTSEGTYNFPVNKSSHYFLRLYFYPSPYPNFNTTQSYFSVVAGGLTLLKNFSAAIAAQALTQAYIMREFYLAPLNSDVLKVTFKQSEDNGSFAFVNGIEVIPAPNLFDSAKMVGFDEQSLDVGSANLQTMVRLNVGGQYIAPANDSSGLGRSWYDDTPYIFGSAYGMPMMIEKNETISYSNFSESVAPFEVYATSRQMGIDGAITVNYNLTWNFRVDTNFTYLMRLHFCESYYTKMNERAFKIFINNDTAMQEADVVAWTGGARIPIYKDFAIYIPAQAGETLWLALAPDAEDQPSYYDMILNGLELFKISNVRSNSLAGPNPKLSDLMQNQLDEEANRSFQDDEAARKGYATAIIGGATGGALAFAFIAAFVGYRRKRKVGGGADGHTSSWLPLYSSQTSGSKSTISGKSHGGTNISSDAAANCRYFSLQEIKKATKNFDDCNVIGVGGFGKVYKGVIDGDTKVAIKRSNPSSDQGVLEFQTEIEMLSKLRHKHLVSLIGFCEDNGEMILVYDYMEHGTLREHLYKGNKITLTWKQRLEICIGAARGLHYLHTGAKYTIIHRDVKTTNILLDDKWVAKVSDFGLSKTGPELMNQQDHVSTVVKGSFGYLDPEYFRRQQLTEKSDVYSFGVVLFEVLCARPALNPSLPKEQVSLADWALHCQRKGTLADMIDPHLKGKIDPECLQKFAETAEKCLADHGIYRPSFGDVLWNLEYCLQREENPDGSAKPASGASRGGDDEQMDHHSFLAMHRNTLSLGSEPDGKDSEDDGTDDIFSQIINPKGR